MWSCQGTPLNFSRPIFGKVSRNGTDILSRRISVLVTHDPAGAKRWLYAAMLTDQKDTAGIISSVPCVTSLSHNDIQKLQEGDIILIEPDGRVNLLFDIDSNDNAILATEQCNCRCIMCPQPPQQDRSGLQDLNFGLLRLMDPERTRSMCITGGEPTLLGDGFIRLVAECKRRLPRTPLAVLTNGKTFRDFGFTRKVIEIGHPQLTFCIALYSDNDKLHDEIVGVSGSFYDTVKGITNLALFNQRIEIRNVISAKNFRRLPQYANFIYRNFPFAFHIAFMGMEMTGLAVRNYDQVWISPVDYMPELGEAVKCLERARMHVSIFNLPFCLLPEKLWHYSRKSISDWKNEYLDICSPCRERERCGGLFKTSGEIASRGIKPFLLNK